MLSVPEEQLMKSHSNLSKRFRFVSLFPVLYLDEDDFLIIVMHMMSFESRGSAGAGRVRGRDVPTAQCGDPKEPTFPNQADCQG